MRHKKHPLPPSLVQPPEPKAPAPIDADKIDVRHSLYQIESVLTQALDPNQAVTPGELQDLCGMYLSVMHMRKVTPEFWLEHQGPPFKLHALASQIKAEAGVQGVLAPESPLFKTMGGAIQLSIKEIKAIRLTLLETLKVMQECPLPGDKIH